MTNQATWNRRDIVELYAARRYITPAETRVLATSWSNIEGGAILDIGIGRPATESSRARDFYFVVER